MDTCRVWQLCIFSFFAVQFEKIIVNLHAFNTPKTSVRKHGCDKLQTAMCVLCFCFGSSPGVIHFRRLHLLCYQSSFTVGDVCTLKLEVKATPAALSRLTCAAVTVRYLGSPSCSDDSSSSSSLPLYSYSVSSKDNNTKAMKSFKF